MKALFVFALAALVSFSAGAQESAGTFTTTSNEESFRRWQMWLSSENYTYGIDQRDLGSKAPVVSVNSIGLIYNFNPHWAVELRQYVEYASNRENLSGRDLLMHQNATEMGPIVLRLAAKPTWGVFGSKPALWELRYYAPTDRVSKENKELGLLRAEFWAEWMLSPRWSVALWLTPRVRLNSADNPNSAKGSDAEYYEMKGAPYVNYYFNDELYAYYGYILDQVASEAQRGNWTPDDTNWGSHEVGIYWTIGAVTVNPALISDTNLANAEGSIFTPQSRAFATETLSYNLNLFATF
jgi:hypothetical protein